MNAPLQYTLLLFGLALSLYACSPTPADYEEMCRNGLESGEIHNDLFLDITFEMSSKDFYEHCWNLNKEQLVKQGPGNLSVQYTPPEMEPEVQMLFYPKFYKDTVAVMPITFEYKAWAPWNKDLFSDKLVQDVVELFESWYGKGFQKVEHPEYGKALVMIDGNREVTVNIKDDRIVNAWIIDLRVVEEWRKLEESTSRTEE